MTVPRGGEAALDDLTRARLPREAEALIMVTDVWMAASHDDFTRAVARRRQLAAETSSFAPALGSLEEERALTREAARRLRAAFPSWDVGAEGAHGAGAVAPALLRRAAAWGADLIVVGSRRPSAQNLTDGGVLKTARLAEVLPGRR
jgi:nucleotide-binding universal stress UspA family protein